ncbi:MAG: hypothetical protein RLZZ458_2939 [Planctomycetota bacterium]|jgi:hypothetical protein
MSNEQQTQQADDPSGDGWRDVMTGGVTQHGDMVRADDNFPLGRWVLAEPGETVTDDDIVRRRIEPQQPSDSEPETMEQLREQVRDLTQELKDKSDSYQICLRNHYKAGQRSTIDRLLIWLRPVVKVVADHPDHSSILAVSVLEFLPQIASRLIEE